MTIVFTSQETGKYTILLELLYHKGSHRTTSLTDLTNTDCLSLSLEGKVMSASWVNHIVI